MLKFRDCLDWNGKALLDSLGGSEREYVELIKEKAPRIRVAERKKRRLT